MIILLNDNIDEWFRRLRDPMLDEGAAIDENCRLGEGDWSISKGFEECRGNDSGVDGGGVVFG